MVNGNNRRPYIGAVAILADVSRLWMQWSLASRVCSVVTANAVVDDCCVVKIRWQPCDRRMAIIAVGATGDVSRMFADRCDAIMARAAGTDDLSVIDRKGRNPGIWRMAVFANNAGLNVVDSLARRVRAVVAACAVARDVDVIKVCRQPTRCGVAVIAVVTAGDMRWMFARCNNTVMAGAASPDHLRVVNCKGRYPDIGIVAILADIRR